MLSHPGGAFDAVWTGKAKIVVGFESFDSDRKGETICVGTAARETNLDSEHSSSF